MGNILIIRFKNQAMRFSCFLLFRMYEYLYEKLFGFIGELGYSNKWKTLGGAGGL